MRAFVGGLLGLAMLAGPVITPAVAAPDQGTYIVAKHPVRKAAVAIGAGVAAHHIRKKHQQKKAAKKAAQQPQTPAATY